MSLVKTNSIDKFFSKPPIKPEPKIESDVLLNPEHESDFSQAALSPVAPITIYDTDPYVYNNKKYSFLNDTLLSQKLGDFMDIDKQFKVQICIFKINSDCPEPFLQYIFNKMGDKLEFPNIDFQCPKIPETMNISGPMHESIHEPIHEPMHEPIPGPMPASIPDPENTQENTQEHTYFMNTCFQELLKILPLQDLIDPTILQKLYKGFIEHNDTLYVFFDSTQHDLYIDSTKYCWSIIDEIIYSRTTEFDQEIVDIFIKNPHIMNILDETGIRITKPILAYGCIQPDSIYKNIEENADKDSISILDETVEHPIFGERYIFSSKPIDGQDFGQDFGQDSGHDFTKIVRYAVFTYNAKYILKDIAKISEEDKVALIEDLDESDDILSIYFKEDGIQLWSIRPDDQFTRL